MYGAEQVTSQGTNWVFWIFLGIGAVFVWFVFFYPKWNVWASHLSGEAEYQQSIKEQKIQISKAQARKDAALLNKEAAIIEAEAVAAQIEKIGKQLTEHDLYLKWQWIKMMEERPDSSVIYVPTEAGLPILEAGKRNIKKVEEPISD